MAESNYSKVAAQMLFFTTAINQTEKSTAIAAQREFAAVAQIQSPADQILQAKFHSKFAQSMSLFK